jgi:hypothetical protein
VRLGEEANHEEGGQGAGDSAPLPGVSALFALVAVFMPMSWMAATHRWLGLGEMPTAPVVDSWPAPSLRFTPFSALSAWWWRPTWSATGLWWGSWGWRSL